MSNAIVEHDAKIGKFYQLKCKCSVSERSIVLDTTKVDCNIMWDK